MGGANWWRETATKIYEFDPYEGYDEEMVADMHDHIWIPEISGLASRIADLMPKSIKGFTEVDGENLFWKNEKWEPTRGYCGTLLYEVEAIGRLWPSCQKDVWDYHPKYHVRIYWMGGYNGSGNLEMVIEAEMPDDSLADMFKDSFYDHAGNEDFIISDLEEYYDWSEKMAKYKGPLIFKHMHKEARFLLETVEQVFAQVCQQKKVQTSPWTTVVVE